MEKIQIKRGKNIVVILLGDVYKIESVGNHSMFYYSGGRGTSLTSLTALLGVLPGNFFRVSRSCIVNLNYKQSVMVNKYGGVIKLTNGESVNVSRRRAVELRRFIDSLVIDINNKNKKNNKYNIWDKIKRLIRVIFSRRG